jgi:hypothetical protein
VRAREFARLMVALARQLPDSLPSTFVIRPELVWQAAQSAHPALLVAAWLADEALTAVGTLRPRFKLATQHRGIAVAGASGR